MGPSGGEDRSSVDRVSRDTGEPLTRVVVRGVGVAGVAGVLAQALTLLSYIVLARLISPSQFGVFAAGSLLVGVAGLISESGMLAVVVQRRDRVDEAASTAFVATIVGGIALGLLALGFAPVLGAIFRDGEVTLVAAALAGTVPIRQSMIVPEAILQRRFSIVRRVIVEPAFVVVFGVTAVLGGLAGHDVWALVAATYAAVIAQALLSWVFVRWRPRLRLVSFAMWRELARYGRHVIASEALRVAQAETLTIVIGRFLGTASLGQYAYALRIARQPLWLFTVPASYVLMPALSRISHEGERFRRATMRTVRISAAFALPIAFIMLPLGTALVVKLFGERWLAAGHAVSGLFGLAAGGAAVSVASEVWKSAGAPQWLPRAHGLGTALALGATVAMLPFGLTAVAFGLSAASFGTAGYSIWGIARVIDVAPRVVFREVRIALVAASGMTVVVWLLERAVDPVNIAGVRGLLALVGLGIAGAAAYIAFYAMLAPKAARHGCAVARRGSAALRTRRRSLPTKRRSDP